MNSNYDIEIKLIREKNHKKEHFVAAIKVELHIFYNIMYIVYIYKINTTQGSPERRSAHVT